VATARTLDLEFEFEIEAGLFHDLRNGVQVEVDDCAQGLTPHDCPEMP